jgi:hypothetical protein
MSLPAAAPSNAALVTRVNTCSLVAVRIGSYRVAPRDVLIPTKNLNLGSL